MSKIEGHIINGKKQGKKFFAWLIDPDKSSPGEVTGIIRNAQKTLPDFIFLGGSLLLENRITEFISAIKSCSDLPVVLFPGSLSQVNFAADGILFLSLISGRNADFLIGRHVEIASVLKKSNLEVLPTGYMLIESGQATTASYISNTIPIPFHKCDIAATTAIAGELLGLRFIFMDGGSGAARPVSPEMIRLVRKNISVPLIIGGGIRIPKEMHDAFEAGADIVVVGNILEQQPELLIDFLKTRDQFNNPQE